MKHGEDILEEGTEDISINLSESNREAIVLCFLEKTISMSSYSLIEKGASLKDSVFNAILNEAILDALVEHARSIDNKEINEAKKVTQEDVG